ncbi:ATP-binding protein [Lacisediminimonas sp.]|uniref:hybrid sensor histidine kinase/response regulator n=1 Tax=Lacisediminimonas sp. TaxID=3060582 RepID=UPI002722E959|nr:ATP-binding protein [Lacisediminimonas sp.]MDO8300717.1 ATP-binding protein [Lacisediminimonas sp.]
MLPLSVYQSVFDSATGSECLVSPTADAIILAVNDAFLRSAGCKREDLLGVSLLAVFPGGLEPGFQAATVDLAASLARVIATGKPDTLTLQCDSNRFATTAVTERLQVCYCQVINTPIFDANGQINCISHRTADVTQALRNEEKLRLSTERQAFQLALADRLRFLASAEDILAAASEMIAQHMGITRVSYGEVDDAKGTFLIRNDWSGDGFPDIAGVVRQLDEFGPEVVAALRMREPMVVNDIRQDPRTAQHADAYASLHIRANMAIPLVKSGRLVAILSLQHAAPRQWSANDIGVAYFVAERTWASLESARAQADLRAERDQSQYIFDSMVEGFALIDADWIMRQMNVVGLHMMRLTAAQVIGRKLWDIWPEARGTAVEDLYRRVRQNGLPETLEFYRVYPDMSGSWIELRANPAMNGGLAVFQRDITARKRAEEKLRVADRRKDEFLAMLAHELRNPLAPISAAAELLQSMKFDESAVRETSAIITRQVGHMTALVDDLLDVSRVTRGLIKLKRIPVELGDIVADAIEQATPLIQARHHHLRLQLAPGNPMVTGDEMRLVQIVANLLNNAAKYTPEGGNILVRTEERGAQVILEVSDDGIGMAPTFALQVFDLFAQAERTSDRSLGGLGLGLALVKSLVELHGGTVTCHSEGIGCGSRFIVRLPRLAERVRSLSRVGADGVAYPATRALRVLVVDDNVDAAAMLEMLLEALGHEVQVEHGSLAALKRAQATRFDVYLVDIGLPEMDGNQLVRLLRADPATANALMIAVTGYGQQSDRARALDAGFDEHLVKPLDTKRLTAILAQAERARTAHESQAAPTTPAS